MSCVIVHSKFFIKNINSAGQTKLSFSALNQISSSNYYPEYNQESIRAHFALSRKITSYYNLTFILAEE